MNAFRRSAVRILVTSLAIGYCAAQIDGNAAYQAFLKWRKTAENAELSWEAALNKYGSTLRANGQSGETVELPITCLLKQYETKLRDRRLTWLWDKGGMPST